MRVYRLSAPALAFAFIGTILWIVAPRSEFRLSGGLWEIGIYSLILQVVLTLFLIAYVDDLQDPNSLAVPFDIARYYRRRFLPAFFFAYGLAVSVTTIAIGLLNDETQPLFQLGQGLSIRLTDLVLWAALLTTSLPQLWRAGVGYIGWCLGLGGGCSITWLSLEPKVEAKVTILVWGIFVVALYGIGVLANKALKAVRRRMAAA